MGVKDYICRKVDNLGAGVATTTGALTLGQFPQFLAQYVQRLGGHMERAYLVTKDYPEYASKATELKQTHDTIQHAKGLEKIVEFAKHIDFAIVRGTMTDYVPGIAFDENGLMFCAAGAIAGYVAYEGAKGIANLAYKKTK